MKPILTSFIGLALAALSTSGAHAGWSTEDSVTLQIREAMKAPLVMGPTAYGKYLCRFVPGEKGLNGPGTTPEQSFKMKFDPKDGFKAHVLMLLSDSYAVHRMTAGSLKTPEGSTIDVYAGKIRNGCRIYLKTLARSEDPEAISAVTETACEEGAVRWLKLDPKNFEASSIQKNRLSLEYGICKMDPTPIAPPSELPPEMPPIFGF